MDFRVRRVASLQGELRPPSDKSLTHRAYMLGAAATGPSRVKNPLTGEDCESTLRCLGQMGLSFERQGSEVVLHPARNWKSPEDDLDCGNSGTTIRLMSGLIASRTIEATLVGDASLSRRPMRRIAEPLRLMGAAFEGDTPPVRIVGGKLKGIDYTTPVASAQIKSCILFAGLRAEGITKVTEPFQSRDHTERWLKALGVPVEIVPDPYTVTTLAADIPGFEIDVPADISSTAFFMVATALAPEGHVLFRDLNVNPTRTGILDVFHQVGVPVYRHDDRLELGEPVCDLEVRFVEMPRPFDIYGPLVPRLIDEIPVLAVLATQCDGTSTIRDAGELRVKESDRIELVASALRSMGANVETFDDGMAITGPSTLHGAAIDCRGDHRIAMAFAIAGLIADGETIIHGSECIATSYPNFEKDLWSLAVV